ncbi:hypothetical protein ELI01_18660 [Rhizobium leguminosarum]|nr:hypothetical protein ELI01_18660 [Rhizobium leguminosarum]
MLISSTVISGCSATERLNKAATTQGTIKASVVLPDYPQDCRALTPHAAIDVGAELRSVLVRERGQLDKANSRVGRCSSFYDDLRVRIGNSR